MPPDTRIHRMDCQWGTALRAFGIRRAHIWLLMYIRPVGLFYTNPCECFQRLFVRAELWQVQEPSSQFWIIRGLVSRPLRSQAEGLSVIDTRQRTCRR